jgi:signal transduction histidine kinase
VVAAVGMTHLKTNVEIPVIRLIYSYTSVVILNIVFYKKQNISFIIYDAIILMIMIIFEMLMTLLLAFITGVATEVVLNSTTLLAAANLMDWIVMLAIAKGFIVMASGKGMSDIRTQEFLMFFILIIGEIVLFNFLNEMIVASKTRYEIVIILLIFLLLDLYLTYLLQRISKAYSTEKELELVTQQSMLQLNAYKELNEKYNASRRIIHDVKKHISSLEGLINANKADEAERYKELLNNELNKLMPRFECDSSILTVVINNKLESAESQKIDFKVDAEFTNVDFISNLDITAIFSNLLDNAFEACSELPEGSRHVWLTITRRNYFVFIYLENTFNMVQPDAVKGFASTKKYHQGIGLTNIRNACEKYHGSFNAHTEDKKFITEVLIPIPDNKQVETSAD